MTVSCLSRELWTGYNNPHASSYHIYSKIFNGRRRYNGFALHMSAPYAVGCIFTYESYLFMTRGLLNFKGTFIDGKLTPPRGWLADDHPTASFESPLWWFSSHAETKKRYKSARENVPGFPYMDIDLLIRNKRKDVALQRSRRRSRLSDSTTKVTFPRSTTGKDADNSKTAASGTGFSRSTTGKDKDDSKTTTSGVMFSRSTTGRDTDNPETVASTPERSRPRSQVRTDERPRFVGLRFRPSLNERPVVKKRHGSETAVASFRALRIRRVATNRDLVSTNFSHVDKARRTRSGIRRVEADRIRGERDSTEERPR